MIQFLGKHRRTGVRATSAFHHPRPSAPRRPGTRSFLYGLRVFAGGFSLFVLAIASVAFAAEPQEPSSGQAVDIAKLPDGIRQIDLFLLMGQSNMKGRGEVPPDQKSDPRIVAMQMKNDQWVIARDPLHTDGKVDPIDGKSNAGVGPGLSFAQALAAKEPDVMIGLIPCAVGGSKVAQWQKGVPRSLYDEAIRRAKLALSQGPPGKIRICGVLWLQGESDTKEGLYVKYQQELLKVVDNVRADLGLPELPFVACTIGSFIEKKTKAYPHVKEINEILLGLPAQRPHTACVDARDLTGNIGDNLHYNTESQVAIGPRYAEKYVAMKTAK